MKAAVKHRIIGCAHGRRYDHLPGYRKMGADVQREHTVRRLNRSLYAMLKPKKMRRRPGNLTCAQYTELFCYAKPQAGRWGPTRPEPTTSSRCTYQDLGSIQYTTQTLPLFWKAPRHEQAAFQCKEESQLCHKGQTVVATTTIPGILQLLVQPLLYMMKRIKIYQSTLNDASYLHKITPVSGQMFLQHIWQFEFVVNQ